jgi:DNA-binding NtrC family response regulator
MTVVGREYPQYTPETTAAVPSSDVEVPLQNSVDERYHADSLEMSAEIRSGIKVLVVDDERTLREGCISMLQLEGYRAAGAARGDEAIEMMARAQFDIVLIDLYMSPIGGMEILRSIMTARPETIAIVMTGNATVRSSVDAIAAGAWDYLPKPFSATHLQVLVGRAACAVLMKRHQLLEASSPAVVTGGVQLIGESRVFRNALELARKVAKTNASVMLVGESGTGKELIAQFIHANSRRSDQLLVPLNCAALPEHLLESEMFGHRKGAFTGAERDKVGLFEVADGGTFFLDELTEMPLPLQAKLLRVVQDGVVRRVGSEQQDAVVDVRFISATNRDPRDAIRTKALREDLYYRLNVVPIALPALRDRLEDIPLLANYFLEKFWHRHHPTRAAAPHFSAAAIEHLQTRPWRGNVRELQNVIEHLMVLALPGSVLEPDDIPAEQDLVAGSSAANAPAPPLLDAYHQAKEQVLTSFEREYVVRLVARASGNMSRAARLANVDRTTLYRLLERNGFRREVTEFST